MAEGITPNESQATNVDGIRHPNVNVDTAGLRRDAGNDGGWELPTTPQRVDRKRAIRTKPSSTHPRNTKGPAPHQRAGPRR